MIAKREFLKLIEERRFKELFISWLGWNRYHGIEELLPVSADGVDYNMRVVAERNGLQVVTCEVDELPGNSVCRKIDARLRRQTFYYVCIFVVRGAACHHLWAVPVKSNERRELTFVEYATPSQADLLYSKVQDFAFGLEQETTFVDVRDSVHRAFAVNSEKVTKDFYTGFRKEHKAFAGFISGIDDGVAASDNRNKQWYTSVMLNRLMFCYFIQKKGFLNGDTDYLRHKLEWVRAERGENRFFDTFYKGFLVSLFHDGLNTPRHTPEWERAYGRIPYLNGGMFDVHELEREYAGIDIADEAFERLFAFFDTWRWHLDTRITASGKDINPDVLGYIFEQYINDRAAMGAYYTKEDITEYIGKNCILPFLLDRLRESDPKAFKPQGEVWTLLRDSGDAYIYDAVKRGYRSGWQSKIPAEIAVGLDTTRPGLLERRKHWNNATPEAWALPTEIWRETVERLQRCDMLLGKIAGGEITEVNDFITYNLDIRQFVYDLLRSTGDHLLVKHFYDALRRVTVLDPTCGSGAFLFAAMNILEPLYEVCIERMQEFHEANERLFNNELNEITNKYRSNIQYFIYKSIILRNLYGVDIMVEATEIAKLRLFLKMVAVVEVDRRADNMGLDPLPDIDFNIRCGNTLVGYATEAQLAADLGFAKDILEDLANQEFKTRIDREMQLISQAFARFKELQLSQDIDQVELKHVKAELRERLSSLNELLNRRLHSAMSHGDYSAWLRSHQPFHWLAEFYQIMHDNGGFDVIIGNPPYVEYNKKSNGVAVSDIYRLHGYNTISCGNLYAFVLERSKILGNVISMLGFIIPSASICTPRMNPLLLLLNSCGATWTSIWDERPSKLFDGVDQQLSIYVISKRSSAESFVTSMKHWASINRNEIFRNLNYVSYSQNERIAEVIPKYGHIIERKIISKIIANGILLSHLLNGPNNCPIYYRNAGGRYWRLVKSFPTFYQSQFGSETSTEKIIMIPSQIVYQIIGVLSSSLFYWYWRVCSNCRHLTNRELEAFVVNEKILQDRYLQKLTLAYESDLKKNKVQSITNNKTKGEIMQDFYYVKLSKSIIDEIDKVLAEHYGFTEEELDFIINYDIKYRMGDELGGE